MLLGLYPCRGAAIDLPLPSFRLPGGRCISTREGLILLIRIHLDDQSAFSPVATGLISSSLDVVVHTSSSMCKVLP
jgi:hypothetical protein